MLNVRHENFFIYRNISAWADSAKYCISEFYGGESSFFSALIMRKIMKELSSGVPTPAVLKLPAKRARKWVR